MCITFHTAELSNTKLYAGEACRGDTYVHVIAYQNKAATKGPNAMILPLPAAVMPGRENVVGARGLEHLCSRRREGRLHSTQRVGWMIHEEEQPNGRSLDP